MTLDVRDARQVQQVGAGAGAQPIGHVLQHSRQHAPAHVLAELDHAGGEAVAGVGQRLDEAARGGVFARDGVDGELVAEVAQLEGGVEAAVDAGRVDFGRGAFGEDAAAVAPGWCGGFSGLIFLLLWLGGMFCFGEVERGESLHLVNEAGIEADVLQDSKATFVQALHLRSEDGPVDVGETGGLDGREHVEDVHLAVHHEGPECSLDLVVHEYSVVQCQRRRDDSPTELRCFVTASLVDADQVGCLEIGNGSFHHCFEVLLAHGVVQQGTLDIVVYCIGMYCEACYYDFEQGSIIILDLIEQINIRYYRLIPLLFGVRQLSTGGRSASSNCATASRSAFSQHR